jgi:5-methylthioadenosine/S-adenosylhomocysteine deaminase
VSYTIQGALRATAQGYETVDVQITHDRISAIAPQLEPVGTLISGHHKLLLPGFINAHTHSPEMWQRGLIRPLPLELWLAELYRSKPLYPEQIYLSALHTALETLLSGGTTLVDHLILIPGQEAESIAAAVRAYREVGIRAFVAPLIHDEVLAAGVPSGGQKRPIDPPLSSASVALKLIEDAVERFHRPDQGIHLMVAPTGTQLCSNQLLEGCLALSDRYQLCLHTHLLETLFQKLLAQEKYGCSAVEFLKQLGFLTPHTSLAHCVWLEDSDIEILAATQATVVHNPLSNLRLGSGIAPLLKYRQAGVNVTFGCDGAASNDAQDLLEAIKMAALGGAKGLNQGDELGTLTVGKKADLVLYDLTNLSLLPRTDPIGLLVLGRPTQAVHSVWVDGKQVIAAGQVTTIDMDHLRQELWHHSQWSAPSPDLSPPDLSSPDMSSLNMPLPDLSPALSSHSTPEPSPMRSPLPDEYEAHYRSVMGLNSV